MSVFSRRKLSCFYCNQPIVVAPTAPIHPNGRVSYFACPHCGADNHLDQRGEILDFVPSPARAPAPQYAVRSRPRHTSPPPPDPPTFCRTCQNSQKIVANAISQYPIPPDDHPDYHNIVNVKFPEYLRQLEEKYPQMCATCEPKVNQRIKKSNYNAKVASLGQMRARTDQRQRRRGRWDAKSVLKSAVWWARGAVWVAAHLMFLVWHGSAMLHPLGARLMEEPTWEMCLRRSVEEVDVDPSCYDVSAQYVKRYYLWSIPAFFWIYRQHELERYPEKKLIGGREFFKLEVFISMMRYIAWQFLTPGGVKFTTDAFQRLHLGFFFVSFLGFLYSITVLRLEDPPTFSLREEQRPSSPSPRPSPQFSKRNLIRPVRPSTPPHLPQMRSQTLPTIPPSYREPTNFAPSSPPPSFPQDDTDAMDWNPTTPTPRGNPSPFAHVSSQTGRAPPQPLFAAPPNIFSQFRNPAPPSLDSSPQKSDVFSRFSDSPSRLSDPRHAPLPGPKFIPPLLTNDDTGLESILSGGLRIEDDPDPTSTIVSPEQEPLWMVIARIALLAVAAFAPWIYGFAAPVLVGMWRLDRIGAVETAVAVAAVAARNEKPVYPVLLLVAGVEVWEILKRMQRERKRAFWREEKEKEVGRRKKNEGMGIGAMGLGAESPIRRSVSPAALRMFGGSGR